MKQCLFFLIPLCVLLACSSTSETKATIVEHNSTTVTEPSNVAKDIDTSIVVLKEYELEPRQEAVWDSVKKEWYGAGYKTCLKKNKIKINCEDCPAAFIHAQLYIDATGQLTNYKLLKKRDCSKEPMEACFMDYFEALSFPKELRGMAIEVRLGHILKC
ncbi:MAG: hypothetical protein GY810_29875 [Aureispira sp.]|nr:hypothetical protein [Aureispira sp.]